MTQEELLQLIDQAANEGWQELDLKDKGLTTLPPEIGRLTRLRKLDLSSSYPWKKSETPNQLRELPAEIGQLRNLERLYLRNNQLAELPVEIWRLQNISRLDLSSNQLAELPAEIGQLRNLERIYFRSNQLADLPAEIRQLRKLKGLFLTHNQLAELSAEIGQLRNLEVLDLENNQLAELPPEIGQLRNLSWLNLSHNQLAKLPAEIGQLRNLEGLDLSHNQLAELPAEIGQLCNLGELYLGDNHLADLPAEIGQLRNLSWLYLSHNQLADLPAEIGQLRNLSWLDISNNQLTELPAEIGQLRKLERLHLSYDLLAELPAEIWQLRNLKRLDFSHNKLAELPAEIGQLSKLKGMDLSDNHLTDLPAEIGRLHNLEELGLSHNQLAEMPPEIGQLRKLERLYLGDNHLAELPAEIGQLSKLKMLNLSSNRLSKLPAEIGQLRNLEGLYLRSNQLAGLPAEIGQLSKLKELELGGNPWNDVFSELVKGSAEELFAYLRSLLVAIPQYEAKVLLVGEGAVGKTSLLRALRGEKFDPELSTTHGIEIKQVEEVHPDTAIEDHLILNFWDFGGQEVYRITHQFFFSENALYLLVWKPREGQEENNLEGWLERIHLRVGDKARVLIIATHCNERHPELDYPSLQAKYPRLLAGHLAIDSADDTGIDELHRRIAQVVSEMEHVGTPFNRRWLDARDELKALPQTHITYDDYVQVCAKHGLNATDASALIGMMHTLGHIIYYDSEGLRDFVVLKPEWLTKAIGYVLEDKPTREAGGILDHRRLNLIWSEHGDPQRETYAPSYFPFFLRLMEQYDVSVRLAGEEASLVPQMVPYERPDFDWQADGGQLSLVCEMEQNPPGLIAWTTARNHRWSTGHHWRNGLFLRHEDGHEALIDFSSRLHRRLSITVRGEYPPNFMGLLRDGLEQLIRERWPYLTYRLVVPCPHLYNGQPCTGSFPLQTLYKARAKGIRTMLCQTCLEPSDVGLLLEGYVLPEESFRVQLAEMQQQLQQVLAKLDVAAAERQQIMAQAAEMTRRVLRAMMDEARNGPRLFTLSPIDPTRKWDPRNLASEELKLTLWCEHPGHEHALGEEGQYIIRNPRHWLSQVAPYALLSLQVLRIAAPIAGGAIGLAADAIKDAYEPTFDFMDGLLQAAGEGKSALENYADAIDHRDMPISKAEGAALRAYHRLLAEANKSWKPGDKVIYGMVDGDMDEVILRRVTAKSTGDVLWVCPEHYKIYDPGLPHIPEQWRA